MLPLKLLTDLLCFLLHQVGARRRTVKTIEKITGTMKMVAQAQLTKDAAKAAVTKQCYFNLKPMYNKLPDQSTALFIYLFRRTIWLTYF